MEKIYSFKSINWAQTKENNRIAYIGPNSLPEEIWNPSDLANLNVLIDGVPYLVIGVEKHIIDISPNIPYDREFGLIVRMGVVSAKTDEEILALQMERDRENIQQYVQPIAKENLNLQQIVYDGAKVS